jgi:type IV pilus assembly protein PilC
MTSTPFLHSRLTLETLQLLSRNLSDLLAAKTPLPQAVALLAKQKNPPRLAAALAAITADLPGGATAAEAFLRHETVFGTLFCQLIAQGETTGDLASCLARLADYYEQTDSFNKKIFRTIKYPAIVLAGITGTIIVVLTAFVAAALPRAGARHHALPHAAETIIAALSYPASHRGLLAAFLAASLLVIIGAWYANVSTRGSINRWRLKSPFFRNVGRKKTLWHFSNTLSVLVSCGMKPSAALETAAAAVKNAALYKKISPVLQRKETNADAALSLLLKESELFPPLIVDALTDHPQPPNGPEPLKQISEFYKEETIVAITANCLIFGPAIVVILGLLGIGILIAFYPPVCNP